MLKTSSYDRFFIKLKTVKTNFLIFCNFDFISFGVGGHLFFGFAWSAAVVGGRGVFDSFSKST